MGERACSVLQSQGNMISRGPSRWGMFTLVSGVNTTPRLHVTVLAVSLATVEGYDLQVSTSYAGPSSTNETTCKMSLH